MSNIRFIRKLSRSSSSVAAAGVRRSAFQRASLTTRSILTSNGEGMPEGAMPGLSLDQIQKIAEKDEILRSQHLKIEGRIKSDIERDAVRRKRMIYRSKQRGWLEADLLLGSWAVENVPGLSHYELDEYEAVLNEETIDIYNYISGKDELPEHLIGNSVMQKLKGYALTKNMASPEDYEKVKTRTNLT